MMTTYYDWDAIRKFIEEHKDDIVEVDVGMAQDWYWTAETIYANGAYTDPKYETEHDISVAGVNGSWWATPLLKALHKDGRYSEITVERDTLVGGE